MKSDAHYALRRSIVAASLMLAAALAAWLLMPTQRMSEQWGELTLASTIPSAFGDWNEDEEVVGGIVDPQQQAVLDRIYSQTLTRTYVNGAGDRVMLSVAYGSDQRDGLQVHKPEVCYPAQGFQVRSNRPATISTSVGDIAARHLETVLGARRYEPVTYWMTVGREVVTTGVEKKLAEMKYGFRGKIADGLLFRVSTIDRNSDNAFLIHQSFVNDLLGVLSPDERARFAGV